MKFLLAFLFPLVAWSQQISKEVKIAGHRGGYYFEHPESSLQLFSFIGKKFKTDTITVELDLRKSKNGTLYIMHDETVDRTTNGKGRLDQLEDVDINNLFLKKEDGSLTKERVPTFEEVLVFIENKNINLMLDIKVPVHMETYELVKKHKMESRMMTLTFNMELTKKVSALSNQICLSALIESENDWQQFREVAISADKKIAYINATTHASLIQELKRNKIKIMADVSEAQKNSGIPLDAAGYQNKVKDQSLDILITDFPIEAHKALLKH